MHVDDEGRRVTLRPAAVHLWLRGATFVALGVIVPVLVLGGGDRPISVTVPVLLMTAATAAWFVAALRSGWELDDHGIETDMGRRNTRRLAWTDVDELAPDGADLVVRMRDDRQLTMAAGDAAVLASALDAALDLRIVPAHVTVSDDDAGRS